MSDKVCNECGCEWIGDVAWCPECDSNNTQTSGGQQMSDLTEWWIRPRTTLRRAEVIDVPYGDLRNRFLDQGYVWVVNKEAYDAMKADRDRLKAALGPFVKAITGRSNMRGTTEWRFMFTGDELENAREALEQSKGVER